MPRPLIGPHCHYCVWRLTLARVTSPRSVLEPGQPQVNVASDCQHIKTYSHTLNPTLVINLTTGINQCLLCVADSHVSCHLCTKWPGHRSNQALPRSQSQESEMLRSAQLSQLTSPPACSDLLLFKLQKNTQTEIKAISYNLLLRLLPVKSWENLSLFFIFLIK